MRLEFGYSLLSGYNAIRPCASCKRKNFHYCNNVSLVRVFPSTSGNIPASRICRFPVAGTSLPYKASLSIFAHV